MSESFTRAYGKILNKIHELEGALLDSKECSDMEYLVNCVMRMHKVGDERGRLGICCARVGGEVPGNKGGWQGNRRVPSAKMLEVKC